MRHLPTVVAALVFLSACGERVCSKTTPDGTYRIDYTNVGGDCGDIGSVVVSVQGGRSQGSQGCTTNSEVYSENNCKAESTITCIDTVNRLRSVGVGVVEQTNDDGTERAGTLTMTLTDLDTAEYVCIGTYELKYTKL